MVVGVATPAVDPALLATTSKDPELLTETKPPGDEVAATDDTADDEAKTVPGLEAAGVATAGVAESGLVEAPGAEQVEGVAAPVGVKYDTEPLPKATSEESMLVPVMARVSIETPERITSALLMVAMALEGCVKVTVDGPALAAD